MVGVGQSRKDRRYTTPRTTRHVWVQPDQPGVTPVQGYVLEWRRHSYHWTALVLISATDAEGRPTAQHAMGAHGTADASPVGPEQRWPRPLPRLTVQLGEGWG